jgi:hypothetical protein
MVSPVAPQCAIGDTLQYILSTVKGYIPLKSKIPDIPSNPLVCVRMSPEEKARFRAAASRDGKALGTWLKLLARERAAELKL